MDRNLTWWKHTAEFGEERKEWSGRERKLVRGNHIPSKEGPCVPYFVNFIVKVMKPLKHFFKEVIM